MTKHAPEKIAEGRLVLRIVAILVLVVFALLVLLKNNKEGEAPSPSFRPPTEFVNPPPGFRGPTGPPEIKGPPEPPPNY